MKSKTETESERVLNLNLEDPAAYSIMYAYLLARGVTTTIPASTDLALEVARILSANPNDNIETAVQEWDDFLDFTKLITVASGGLRGDVKVSELELGVGSMGYEVAAVVLRKIAEEDREYYQEELTGLQEAVARREGNWLSHTEAAAQKIVHSYRNDPDVQVTRTGATVTFTEREGA